MKIKSIHFFRGIAILFIIAGHCLENSIFQLHIKLEEMSAMSKFIYNFILGGTGMFVFISGFLFHSVFYKKFQYGDFVIKKIKNVYIPYLILSIYPIINIFFIYKQYKFIGFENNNIDILKSIYTGRHSIGYWYITFIMIVFLLSPIFIKFIESKYKEIIIGISFIVSLFIHRPIDNLNQIHSVIYFSFFYILGIWVSINREKVLNFLKGKIILLLITAVVIIYLQTFVFIHLGNYHKELFKFKGIDLILIQKTILCLIFFKFLTKFENMKLYFLDKLAEYSFVIYFLHPYVLGKFELKIIPLIKGVNVYGIFALEMVTIIIVTISAALILKKILGKYSRYIIGY